MPDVTYLTPEEFARRNPAIGSAVVVRNRVRQGRLPHVRLGRRILIPSDPIERLEREHANAR
jgi:hypothetical protein